MTGRTFLNVGLVVLLMLLAGCSSEDASVRTTAVTAPDPLSDFTDSVELEMAVVAFGECVEESFPIVIRFRPEPFNGMSTEVASQTQEDGDRVDTVTAECNVRFDLDRRLTAYQSEYPLSPEDRRRLVDEFISCAASVSPEISSRVSGASLESATDVTEFIFALPPGDFTSEELVAVSDCEAEMTGPEWVFAEGHAWFTP